MSSIDALVQDLRFSGRLARRSPFLTCAVVATLSLGVGLDAGVFTIVDGAVRQPRGYRIAIGFRGCEYGFDAELAARPNDSRGNLASIRDQNATNLHGYFVLPKRISVSPYSTSAPS